jgi:hypothetical protein
MKRTGEVEVQLHSLFDLGTKWRWAVSFTPGRFTPRERAPGTYWIGGWVDAVKTKIPSPRRESNPRTPIAQPVAQRYTDWAKTDLITARSIVIILKVSRSASQELTTGPYPESDESSLHPDTVLLQERFREHN